MRHECDTGTKGTGRGPSTVQAMTTTRIRPLGIGLIGLLLTAACSAPSTPAAAPTTSPSSAASSGTPPASVLLLGDSVAVGEALPLTAAFEASGVTFRSIASEGGGNVVGPMAEKRWKELPEQIAEAEPTVVVYQLTTYDWGSRSAQRAAYQKLLTTTTRAGADLVFVTGPPIRPDDFYRPHLAELDRAPEVAREVAAHSSGRARVLDASEVWGERYQRTRNGTVDRSTDGIHTCPQGAARFTRWLLDHLSTLSPGFTPAAPRTWANTGWSGDDHFRGC